MKIKIIDFFKKVASVKDCILGAGIIVGTFIVCLIMPMGLVPVLRKLPVLLTAIGTFVGTIIFANGLKRLVELESVDNLDEKVDEKIKLKNYNELETELNKIKAEKIRLEGMKIQLKKLQPVLKLSLLECDLTMYDFKDVILDSKNSSLAFLHEKEVTNNYVGLMCKHFKVNLGIDLNKVRITELDNTLVVSGLACEYQGILDTKTDWKMREIRKRVFKNGDKISESIISADSRISDCMIAQERELNTRIGNGLDIQANEQVVVLFGEKFISMILEPLKKNIRFENNFSQTVSLPLIDFINTKNEMLNKLLLEEEVKEKELVSMCIDD
ncbi:MAG: hypothetical protein CR988_01005 [Treponema sp.]|nr:MAG: hypothetical protein CR988_01005 [Treponema sp.]